MLTLLSTAIAHALYDPEPLEDQYAAYLVSSYHHHGIEPEPMRDLQEGESVVEYLRDSDCSAQCSCGAIGAKPVVVNGGVLTHKCEMCWALITADMDKKRRQYEGMVGEGVHPKIASARVMAKKQQNT